MAKPDFVREGESWKEAKETAPPFSLSAGIPPPLPGRLSAEGVVAHGLHSVRLTADSVSPVATARRPVRGSRHCRAKSKSDAPDLRPPIKECSRRLEISGYRPRVALRPPDGGLRFTRGYSPSPRSGLKTLHGEVEVRRAGPSTANQRVFSAVRVLGRNGTSDACCDFDSLSCDRGCRRGRVG